MKNVSIVNIFSYLLFFIVICFVAFFSFKEVDIEVDHLQTFKNDHDINILDYLRDFSKAIFILGIWLKHLLPNFYQLYFQRMRMANANIKNIRKAFIYGGVADFILKIIIFIIAFNIFSQNQNLNKNQLLTYIANNLCSYKIKGVFAISLIAISISTVITILNSQAVLFSNDVLPLFYKRKNLYTPNLKATRIIIFIIALICLFALFKVENIFNLILYFISYFHSFSSYNSIIFKLHDV